MSLAFLFSTLLLTFELFHLWQSVGFTLVILLIFLDVDLRAGEMILEARARQRHYAARRSSLYQVGKRDNNKGVFLVLGCW
ncbi:uncharacterized protein B0T23DRAFT_388723 [Neurospora hispaniola]|uniref:Uncharacterized protein n=1 Tax=Neurospora hispaniola TaxID=588809 RepID=A0AAJ0I1F7_9PEZI|nr:hypothetical protein B0T23DRAFT_388723 [Neurospora hispaniola]